MVQKIQQANIFGRLGTGIGQGLSQQIPKEIEHQRLRAGLESLANQSDQGNLSPAQFLAQAAGTYGATPQMIQSFGDLAKTQGMRNSFRNAGGRPESNQPSSSPMTPKGQADRGLNDIKFGNMSPDNINRSVVQGEIPQGNFSSGEPQIVEKNPLSPELQRNIPWTPEQRQSEISRVWDQNPYLTFPEVSQLVNDNERRYLESPEAYRQQQADLEETQNKVNDEIESQLRRKLQVPKDKEIWDKISGESHNRIERGVSRDLRKNPDSNVKDLVNKWTDRALENDKTKNVVNKMAARPLDEKLFKKGETLQRLKSASKSFKEFGNSEEYYNILQSDFGTSPEGAASIAYDLSNQAKDYVSKIKQSNSSDYQKNTIKHANNLPDYLTRNDSILSIAKNIKEKDPFFDIKGFLQEGKKIQDELGLSPFQKRELEERGVEDFFPNWGDIFLFPKLGKGI